MEQRTCNIIMCCKGNDKYGYKADPIYSIKRYMGKECAYPWKDYKPWMLDEILYTALADYIDGVKKPSYVLWELREYGKTASSIVEKICSMFACVQVRDENGCVNGFTEDLLRQSEIDLA